MKHKYRHIFSLCAAMASSLACSNDLLVFTTYSKVGLDVTFVTDTQGQAVFGYKRFEGALIPVDPGSDEVQSVFATIDIRSAWRDGLCVRQSFATGVAAENVASGNDKFSVASCTPAAGNAPGAQAGGQGGGS